MNSYQSLLRVLEKVASYLGIKREIIENLKKPKRVLVKKLKIKLENGKKATFAAYRVQHSDLLGPFKGGLRFHQKVNLEELKTLALLMTLKCALLRLPLGGAKGGVVVNPKKLSRAELKKLSQEYIRAFYQFLGADLDIPAPDMNTNPTIMGWMLAEYERLVGYHSPAMITGKPLILGGSKGRKAATGLGGTIVLSELLKKLNKKPPLTVAIQGFGNVGYHLAKFLEKEGFLIVALSDSKGGIQITKNRSFGKKVKSFDIEKVRECKREKGLLAGCYCVGGVCDLKLGEQISNEALLELPVDILVPAAKGGVITAKNAPKIKAKIILEMANNPTTPEADKILNNKGIIVVPDILANGGGVTASYFEWVQGREGYFWEEEKVGEELKKILKRTFSSVWQISQEKKLSLRTASYYLCLTHLQEALDFRSAI